MKKQLTIFLTAGLLAFVASCQKPEIDVVDPVERNPDWTEASHSNDVAPDYTTVFPQDKVNTLEITMTAAEWQAIQTDMLAKIGSRFGSMPNGEEGRAVVAKGAGNSAPWIRHTWPYP